MIDYTQPPSQSLEEVARAGLIEAYKCSQQKRECGGVIYEFIEAGGRKWYFRSPIETSNKPFGVEIKAIGEPAPAGTKMVADFHVHICSVHNKDFSAFFSVGDVIVNQAMHTVGYMLDSCSGEIHRFDPAQDAVDDEEVDFKSGLVLYLTIGHVSGWISL